MNYRKYLALLLALVMCLSLLPGAAMAEGIELAEDDVILAFDVPEEAIVEVEPEEPAIAEEPEEPAPVCDAEPGKPEEPAPFCDAEPEPVAEDSAGELEVETLEQPSSYVADLETFDAPAPDEDAGDKVVGFEELGDAALIVTPYKLALIELQKQFPAELNVRLGGSAGDVRAESVAVEWECLEDYDEDVHEFHFVPVLDLPLADGVTLPVITLQIEGSHEQPVLPEFPELPGEELPIVGILTNDRLPRVWGTLPSYYNGYERGILPPIRNQNPYGTCWAHASIGCLESDLIHDRTADTSVNLSELHLIYYAFHNYTDETGCSTGDTVNPNGYDYMMHGGDVTLAVNRFSNLVGPVQESDAPYFMAASYDPGPDYGRLDNCGLQLSGSYTVNIQDREAVKYNIQTHGGVETAFFAADAYYSSRYNSYYCPINHSINHSVMLVGWDDNFPSENFPGSYKPEGNGAWLVRNSWGGEGYSYYSYFWISYYDNTFKSSATALDVIENKYDTCYAYDGSPFSSYYIMESGVKTRQRFNVNGGERISAVGVEVGTASVDLSIKLSCGSKSVTTSYRTTYPGYQLIPLSETLPVAVDSSVTVEITYTASGDIQIPVEASLNYGGIEFTATCGSGGMEIVYPSSDYSFNTNSDGRTKLFTCDDNNSPVPATAFTITWTSEDGAEILKTERHDAPYTPVWTDAEPAKADEADRIYVFDGWTIDGTTVYNNEAKGSVKAFVPLYADTVFKAHFVESPHNEEYQRSLSLTDSIAIKWRIKKIAEGADASKYSAVVTYKGESKTYTSGLTSGIVLANCAAKEMTEEATVDVFYDGVLIAEGLAYSVNDYCNEMLAKEAETGANKWTRLMQATQDYGYTAMVNYNYPGSMPDGGGAALAYAQAVPALGYNDALTVIKIPDASIGISAINFRLITEAQTILSVAFVKTSGSTKTAADYVFIVDGSVVPTANIVEANGVFEVRIAGIPAKNLDKIVTVCAIEKNGNRNAVFRGSPIGYMSTAAYSAKTGDSLKNMVKALYNYHLEAKNALPA